RCLAQNRMGGVRVDVRDFCGGTQLITALPWSAASARRSGRWPGHSSLTACTSLPQAVVDGRNSGAPKVELKRRTREVVSLGRSASWAQALAVVLRGVGFRGVAPDLSLCNAGIAACGRAARWKE
ncbi:unnamed protein product, partial [Polarella glacialis]